MTTFSSLKHMTFAIGHHLTSIVLSCGAILYAVSSIAFVFGSFFAITSIVTALGFFKLVKKAPRFR